MLKCVVHFPARNRRDASRLVAAIALAAVLLGPGLGRAEESTQADRNGARAVVDGFHGVLLEVMRGAGELGYAGRQARLDPVVRGGFDLALMARKALGRHWKKLSEADREHFVATFSRLAVANYAGRFNGYAGERFESLGAESAALGTVLVHTRIVKSDGEPVQLDYRLRRAEDGWRIFDVFLNGTVSELALRRSEYSAVIRRQGFEGLLRALEEKIADQEQGIAS